MDISFFDSAIQVNYFLQGLGDWLVAPMQAITFLGNEDFYALVLPLILWLVDYSLGMRVGMMLSLSGALNIFLQSAIPSPRPYWYDSSVKRLANPEVAFGFPSGHAQLTSSVYGLIATTVKGGSGVIIWVLIALIGLSRPILGMHFYSDVLAGWVIGGLLLWGYLKVEDRVKNWFVSMDRGKQIAYALGISLGLILLSYVIQLAYVDYQLPQVWVDNALASHPEEPLNPFDLNRPITTSALMFGLIFGFIWLSQRGGFDAKGDWKQKGLRILIGLVGIAVFWMGLGKIFPREENLLSYALRFVRYGLTGFWASGLAPFLFVKWKLAQPNK